MSNASHELGIALDNALAPTIKAAADMVTGLTDAFKRLPPEMRALLARFGVIAAVFAPAALASRSRPVFRPQTSPRICAGSAR
jgi:hypothetical protein